MKTKDIRKPHKLKKKPCFVCEKYKELCQWHHVVPLKDILILNDLGCSFNDFVNEVVPLCPTHHSLIHSMHNLTYEIDYMFINDVEKEEQKERILNILDKRKKLISEIANPNEHKVFLTITNEGKEYE